MLILLGYRTENVGEIPVVLYLGDDGVEAERIAESDPHPRIAILNNPQPRPLKHWDEAAASAFEALNSPPPQPAPVPEETHDNSAAVASDEEAETSPPPPEDAPEAAESEPLAEADPSPATKPRRR